MTIDINELRDRARTGSVLALDYKMVIELLDRLEEAESTRRDDYQNWMTALDRNAELLAKLEAAEQTVQDYLRIDREKAQIAQRLEAAEKERDDVAQQLVQSEIGKREISEAHNAVTRRLSVLADENTALRAKITEMEHQVPVGTLHDDGCFVWRETAPRQSNYAGWKMALYALPCAQPQLNEIKIALQRALELGQRETWTGARKHRSWEDQREEQQCWNKVWSLLGAQGEEK